MRATSMRRLVGGAAALMLAGATLLSMSGFALAAVPQGTATTDALPPTVTGDIVGFRTNLFYTDGSTLAKAYVTVFTTGAGTNRYWSATRNGNPVPNACTVVADQVSCSFKTVRTNDHLAVTVAYDRTAASATGNGVWSSTGSPTSDGGTSHGDTWTDVRGAAVATFDPNATDYAGSFVILTGSTVANSQAVTNANKQATKVTGLPLGVAATVLDGDTSARDCGPYQSLCDSSSIGEWSDVTVGDFTTAFQIVITFYSSTPKSFVHVFEDGGVTQFEQIFPCAKKSAIVPCFTWSSKDKQATITTYHNGAIRGM